MRRQSSHPPLIILMDLLFVLIFILMMNTDDKFTINIPPERLFDNAILVYKSENSELLVNKENGSITSKSLHKDDFYYYQQCGQQCSKYNVNYREKMFIYFPHELFNSISKLTFLAANTSFNCNNIQFDITQEGEIDYELLFSKNSCLNQIPGSEHLQ